MDVENTNGCHLLGDGLTDPIAATPSPDHLNAIDDFKLHMDFKPLPNTMETQQQQQQPHAEFIFGNGDGNFNGGTVTTTTTSTTITAKKANGNDQFDVDEHDDDFGPETDVDATDDAAISPLSPSLENTNNELNNENVIGKFNENGSEYFLQKTDEAVVASNPFASNEQILKKDEDFNDNENQMSLDRRFDDNRFLDNFGAENIDEFHGNKIDFSEKKEYSFEREDYEKELDPIGDVPAELIAISKEAAVAAADDEKEEAAISDSTENIIDSSLGEIITTEQHGEYKNVFNFFSFRLRVLLHTFEN